MLFKQNTINLHLLLEFAAADYLLSNIKTIKKHFIFITFSTPHI